MKVIPDFPNYTICEKGVVRGTAEKAQTLGKNGYKYVTLYHRNQGKKLYIHRLLAELYIPNPENKRTVNHIDGNKQNNCLTNLEWATDGENIKHAYNNGLNKGRSNIDNELRKLLYTRFMNGESMEHISKDFLQNGPSDLSKKSAFSKITGETKINAKVKYHLIMGNDTDSEDKDMITDGVVPYHSAHIDGAVSEKIIKGGHSIHIEPEAVLEVRRILRLHLQELGLYKP